MRSWLLAAAAATLAACASSSTPAPADAPPAAVIAEPVGIYDFTTTADGTAVTGTVTITKAESGYTGSITTNVTDPIAITMVSVEATRINVTALTPDGPLSFIMDMAGNDFTGTWALGEMTGTHTGRRRTP